MQLQQQRRISELQDQLRAAWERLAEANDEADRAQAAAPPRGAAGTASASKATNDSKEEVCGWRVGVLDEGV